MLSYGNIEKGIIKLICEVAWQNQAELGVGQN